ENEKHEHLPAQVAQLARKGHEVEIHRQQHQLDAHQQQDHVLPVEEDAGDAEREQDAREHQYEVEGDHDFFSGSILTTRVRSRARTDTCAATSCCFRPVRWRMVSTMAATMASNRITAASSNGYRYLV